jgi:acyl transferase domain-containing protein
LRDREQRVGVFAGVSTVEYHFAHLRNGLRVDRLSPYMGTGAALSGTAARVALGLRLNGPVMTVDTACSSALTAVHLASTSLRLGECDMAIVGACHLQLAPFTTAVFNEAKMLSPTGRSLPFTAKADGHVRSEGCGALVLKRLRDAKADGDKPYAIIRGASVHQQGDRATMTAMPAAGQRRVMVEALRRAEIDAFDVRFVEAQANGSKLSGAIEVEATADAYRRAAPGAPPLYLGSCKANLGYMETASGAASLMKAALLLRHAQIPPQPGSGALDPDIRWDRFTIAVPQVLTPWPAGPRRLAGVSSFGFTGTNAHVILEAAADTGARPPYPGPGTPGRRYWPDTHNWT